MVDSLAKPTRDDRLIITKQTRSDARAFSTQFASVDQRDMTLASTTTKSTTTRPATATRGARARHDPSRASSIVPRASNDDAPSAVLRQLLRDDKIIQAPCAHDALSARLIERAGFDAAFMSGFCVSASRLALPDTGLISYGEMVDVGRTVNDATSASFPIIGDGDDGYGNAMSTKRTVKGYAKAGFAGVLIEDQVAPKACGHTKNRRVVSREEARTRVRAACDARDESGSGIVVFARSDSRSAVDLDEALWRAAAFADEGADALFIDALRSKEEMRAFCKIAPGVPKMANMLEGGGSTPICSPEELQDMGFSIVAYPLSLLAVSVKAMERALHEIKSDGYPSDETLPTFVDLQASVGFPEYYAEDERYK